MKYNKGFSLVELIIVIAIMAILAAAIAPALIRYINKARKADDIAAADSIGTMFQAAITEDELLYDAMNAYASDTIPDGREYRVVAYCNPSGRHKMSFHLPSRMVPRSIQNSGKYTDLAGSLQQKMKEYLGDDVAPMKFRTETYFDQWVICIDKNSKISIWVGGGMGDTHAWILTNGGLHGRTGPKFYKIWPTVDPAYNQLTVPPRTWSDGSR